MAGPCTMYKEGTLIPIPIRHLRHATALETRCVITVEENVTYGVWLVTTYQAGTPRPH